MLVTALPTKDLQTGFHGKQQEQMKKSKRNVNWKDKAESMSDDTGMQPSQKQPLSSGQLKLLAFPWIMTGAMQ